VADMRAARFLDVSASWVYMAARSGVLSPVRIGRSVRFRPALVRALVQGSPAGKSCNSRGVGVLGCPHHWSVIYFRRGPHRMSTPNTPSASARPRRGVRISAWLFILAVVLYLLEWRGAGIGFGILAFVFETLSTAALIMKDRRDDTTEDPRD